LSWRKERMMNQKSKNPGRQNPDWEAEARERWGHTDAHRESARRTKSFSEEDWARIRAETEEVEAHLAEVFLAGHAPTEEIAMDAAEAHRLQIENFYPCTPAMHVGLGRMYTADPRFTAHYDQRAEGLAAFLQAAIEANAKRAST
jgi:hypothetical protein